MITALLALAILSQPTPAITETEPVTREDVERALVLTSIELGRCEETVDVLSSTVAFEREPAILHMQWWEWAFTIGAGLIAGVAGALGGAAAAGAFDDP